VLEIWSIADDTMAETLVGLVRALVRVPPAAALQRYATSVIDGSRAIVNPFDITSRGKLTADPASLASSPSMQALTTADPASLAQHASAHHGAVSLPHR
jgi:hypothetical protein